MTDKNKILICWNNTAYIKNIKIDGYEVEPFTSKDSLNTIEQKAKYIVVLCELLWSHDEGETYSYSDLNGIKLGQWLRREKNIKTPILFVSFLSRKIILDIQPDAQIISTPALKHGFCQLPANTETWIAVLDDLTVNKFLKDAVENENRNINYISAEISDLDLIYTKRRFCGIIGLLERIKHDIYSCRTKAALNEKREKLQYADKISGFIHKDKVIQLGNDINNIQEENNIKEYERIHKEFRKVCTEIIAYINQNSEVKKQQTRKKYSILYLEDEQGKDSSNQDERIESLISTMQNQGFTVQLMNKPNYSQIFLCQGTNIKFDAVICDIEIWEGESRDRELTCLGYDYIQHLSKMYRRPVYIILSNITRSLHNSIINSIGTRVNTYSKSDVLSSDSTMQVFIDGIRNLIEQKTASEKSKHKKNKSKKQSVYLDVFKCFCEHIENINPHNSIEIANSGKIYNTPEDVENFVTQEFTKYKNIFDEKYQQIGKITNNFMSEKSMPEKIKPPKELDKTKMDDNGGQYRFDLNKEKITTDGNIFIDSFIQALIARRLLLYVMLQYVNITNLHSLFTTNRNKAFLQSNMLITTKIKKSDIWNDDENKIQGNCANFLTKQEISYIKQLMINSEG